MFIRCLYTSQSNVYTHCSCKLEKTLFLQSFLCLLTHLNMILKWFVPLLSFTHYQILIHPSLWEVLILFGLFYFLYPFIGDYPFSFYTYMLKFSGHTNRSFLSPPFTLIYLFVLNNTLIFLDCFLNYHIPLLSLTGWFHYDNNRHNNN